MALNKNERRALELAREEIGPGCDFICTALYRVGRHNPELVNACGRIKEYIMCALWADLPDRVGNNIVTLETWQKRVGVMENSSVVRTADRLAWIDWMLGKPLAGEVVKLEWRPKPVGVEEAEYCGRFFSIMRLEGGFDVIEIEDPAIGERLISRIGFGFRRHQINAAIVAHVWPALPPDEPRHV